MPPTLHVQIDRAGRGTLSRVQRDKINELFKRIPVQPAAPLEAEFAVARRSLKIAHLRALECLGVSRGTLAEFNRDFGFGVVKAIEHPSEPGLYILDPEGAPHLLLPAWEDGELVDLLAFRSAEPRQWLLRSGQGWALGLEDGLGPHCWGDSVPLAVSPLDWLRQGTVGLCVLDWDAPELLYLLEVPHIVCASDELAARLRASLSRPIGFPEITVGETRLAA